MPVTSNDQFQVALERELQDVVAREDLAACVIARYRRSRRRRVAGGVCFLLAIAGLALGLATTTPGPVELRLTGYTLTLPAGYHLARDARSPCQVVAVLPGGLLQGQPQPAPAPVLAWPATLPGIMAAARSSGGCISVLVTTPAPAIPPGAREVAVRGYRAWFLPAGAWLPALLPPPQRASPHPGPSPHPVPVTFVPASPLTVKATNPTTVLVVDIPEPKGESQGLVISSRGLSEAALLSLVAKNLSFDS